MTVDTEAALDPLPPAAEPDEAVEAQAEMFTPDGAPRELDPLAGPAAHALAVIRAAAVAARLDQGGVEAAEQDVGKVLDHAPPPDETVEAFLLRITPVVEGIIFAGDHPVPTKELIHILTEEGETQANPQTMMLVLERLAAKYPASAGVTLQEVAGGWVLRTAPHAGRYLRRANHDKPFRMGRAAVETLAMIAYRQPVTKAQIDELRGVDSSGALKALLDKHLVRVLGKAEEVGRPLLYGTTKVFLEAFNLKMLSDLPTLREYQELSAENQAKVDAQAPVQQLGRIRDLAQKGARLVSEEAEQEGAGALEELDRALGDATNSTRTAEMLLKAGGKLPPGVSMEQVMRGKSTPPPSDDESIPPGDSPEEETQRMEVVIPRDADEITQVVQVQPLPPDGEPTAVDVVAQEPEDAPAEMPAATQTQEEDEDDDEDDDFDDDDDEALDDEADDDDDEDEESAE